MEMDEKTAVVAGGNAGCALAVNFSIAFASFFFVSSLSWLSRQLLPCLSPLSPRAGTDNTFLMWGFNVKRRNKMSDATNVTATAALCNQ